jgi:DNA-binding IclR family transcriptional regulator
MNGTDERYIIPNLWRAFDVLEFLAKEPEGQTISEIVEGLEIPTNSVFRILRTLAAREYVVQKHKRYEVSSKLFALGAQAIAEESLFERIYPAMKELRDEVKETVIMGKIFEGKGIVLEQLPGKYPVKVIVEVGASFDFHDSAPGKAILAFLPENEREELLKEHEYTIHTSNTITDKETLLAEFAKIRETGIAYDMEELDESVCCVSCPIFNSHGYPIAALWITGPSSRISAKDLETAALTLKKEAISVSQSLGYFA